MTDTDAFLAELDARNARALERIAKNAVDIAEQTVFIVIGLFREFAVAEPAQQ